MKKRGQGIPIAYLTERREFWSLDFIVTEDTLIPRPETECLVECALALLPERAQTICDLGTGAGSIALALAHERPDWTVHATDVCEKALQIATQNAERFQLKNVHFFSGQWCQALPTIQYDMIVSNPPYVAVNDPHLAPQVKQHEPWIALFSEEEGLKDIKTIIQEAKFRLKPGGFLLLEHGFQQAERIRSIFSEVGYTTMNTKPDLSGLDRVTMAQTPFLV
jgi:release factor glutamine methyltransferase